MTQMSLDDLIEILRACAGADEDVTLDGSVVDTPFDELGYDSLALLETASQVKRRFGVEIGDDEIGELATPRDLLDRVNRHLAAA